MVEQLSNRKIITVALTGSKGLKEKNINTPITPDEIIEDAYQSYLNGASICHIHVKDDDGINSEINIEKFEYIKQGIQSKCDIVINFSTSGETNIQSGLSLMGTPDVYQTKRLEILEVKPEVASYDLGTMNFGEQIFMNPLGFLRKSGQRMQELSIVPEVEVYSLGDIDQAKRLIKEGVLPKDVYFQICLGIRGGTPATVKNLITLQEALPPNGNWSAFGIGEQHLPILYTTIALGGNVRVGLEDNVYYTKGQKTSNVELVSRANRLITEFGLKIATPEQARKILKIK